MESNKIKKFLQLAGNSIPESFNPADAAKRKLGAQLLLSELMEYIIKGLKITPVYNGQKIENPEGFIYESSETEKPDQLEMLDGLADVAYTMYWNSEAFGLKLEEAFELVCDNNLEKFIRLDGWQNGECAFEGQAMDCGRDLKWPEEVCRVEVKLVEGDFYAVGKDQRGKVRKPLTYKSVNLKGLLS